MTEPDARPSDADTETAPLIEEVGEATPRDERVAELIEHTIDVPVLASAVEQQEAADAADVLETLDEEQAADVLEQMDDQSAAEALAEMQTPLAVGVLRDVIEEELAYAARLLAVMAPDDAADLLQALDESYREEALAAMPLAAAAALRKLIGYDRESAGGMMTPDYLALDPEMTVADATEAVRAHEFPEGAQHLPVVGADGRLVGVVSLRDLLLARPEHRIDELARETVKAVRPGVDREQVAHEFDRYDYTMLPVVDLDDRLIGVVTVDDVIDIIRDEQTEDVQRTVGAGAVEAVYSHLGEKFRGRFPWLAASLVMTCLAAIVVLLAHDMIARLPILAFLMALIAPLVGNAGHQALAVTLRGIILDEVRRERVSPLVLREATVGLLNGAALGGLILAGMALLGAAGFEGASWQIGAVAAVSTTAAMTAGTLAGAAIPLVMRRLGADPAHASAIVLIMITDGVSFSILLSLSFALIRQLPA